MSNSIPLLIGSNELSPKIFLPACGGFRINNRLYDNIYVSYSKKNYIQKYYSIGIDIRII